MFCFGKFCNDFDIDSSTKITVVCYIFTFILFLVIAGFSQYIHNNIPDSIISSPVVIFMWSCVVLAFIGPICWFFYKLYKSYSVKYDMIIDNDLEKKEDGSLNIEKKFDDLLKSSQISRDKQKFTLNDDDDDDDTLEIKIEEVIGKQA